MDTNRGSPRPRLRFSTIAPGILLAATGVGAGDILTTSLAGSEVGLALLWAVLAGAILKFVLTEGVARWQLATGTSLLEGWTCHLGGWIRWVFFVYLLLFTMSVGGALVTACGVAGSGLLPLGEPVASKIAWGILHSLAGLALAWYGSFRLFEVVMSVLVGAMFVTVVATAVLTGPDWSAVAQGLLPSIPPGGRAWSLAVIGGVGGTVTLLSYGYWIREEGRAGAKDLAVCRLDLGVGNAITALFGVAALTIGSRIELEGQGSTLALQLAGQLASVVGAWGKWIFLIGFWGAVFSSLLGVWQSVPYLFATFFDLTRGKPQGSVQVSDLRRSTPYRAFLLFISSAPLIFLWRSVREIQLAYGLIGALFLPLLALTLLMLNNRRQLVGASLRNHWAINAVLMLALLFFAYLGIHEIYERLQ